MSAWRRVRPERDIRTFVQQLESAEQGRRVRWTRSALVALSVAAGAGCTEPMFVLIDDGGVDAAAACRGDDCLGNEGPEPGLDDSMVPDPGKLPPPLPAYASRLPGNYAVRIRHYGTIASSARAVTELVGLGEIDSGNNDFSLQLTVCRETTEIQLASGQKVSRNLTHPAALRRRFFPIRLEEQQWRTVGQREQIGYGAVLAQCTMRKPGEKVMSDDIEQAWLRGGQCTCVEPSDTPPVTPEDCRLLDDEKDTQPGITLQWSDGTRATTVILEQSQLVHGVADPEGRAHHAKFELGETRSQITCQPQSSPMCAFGGSITGCLSDFNDVDFVRLTEPSDCARLLKSTEGDGLFPVRATEFPAICQPPSVKSTGSVSRRTGD